MTIDAYGSDDNDDDDDNAVPGKSRNIWIPKATKIWDYIKAESWHGKWHVDEDDDDDNNEDNDDDKDDSGNDDGDTGNDDDDMRMND